MGEKTKPQQKQKQNHSKRSMISSFLTNHSIFLLLSSFKTRVFFVALALGNLLCSPCWLQSHRDLPASASWVLEIKARTTTSQPDHNIFKRASVAGYQLCCLLRMCCVETQKEFPMCQWCTGCDLVTTGSHTVCEEYIDVDSFVLVFMLTLIKGSFSGQERYLRG